MLRIAANTYKYVKRLFTNVINIYKSYTDIGKYVSYTYTYNVDIYKWSKCLLLTAS